MQLTLLEYPFLYFTIRNLYEKTGSAHIASVFPRGENSLKIKLKNISILGRYNYLKLDQAIQYLTIWQNKHIGVKAKQEYISH